MFKKFDMLILCASCVLGFSFDKTRTIWNKLISRKEVGIFLGIRQCAFWND